MIQETISTYTFGSIRTMKKSLFVFSEEQKAGEITDICFVELIMCG